MIHTLRVCVSVPKYVCIYVRLCAYAHVCCVAVYYILNCEGSMTNSAFVPWSAILCFGNRLYCEALRAMAIKLLNIYFCVSRNKSRTGSTCC